MKLFAGLVAIASATPECDECWQLGDDGQCHPDPDHVSTLCWKDSMTVNIDQCVFGSKYDYTEAYIGDNPSKNECTIGLYGTEIIFSQPHDPDQCGTTVAYDDSNGIIKFKNRLIIPGKLDSTSQIVTTQPLEWSFECQYASSYQIQDNEMTMNNAPKSSGFTGTGQFQLTMDTYNTTDFDHLLDEAEDPHQIGQPVNFGVSFNNGAPIDNLVFAPTECKVINAADTSEDFTIWNADAGTCDPASNPVGFEIIQNPENNRAFYGMTYSGFGFNSVEGESQNQRIQCQIEICLADSENSACNAGCFNAPSPTSLPSSPPATSAPSSGCNPSEISESQYCYTIPDKYGYYDNFDDNADYFHGYGAISVNETITMSRICAPDYHQPGTWHNHPERFGKYGCETKYEQCDSNAQDMLSHAVFTENGYITALNCPQCGCTENGSIKLDEWNPTPPE